MVSVGPDKACSGSDEWFQGERGRGVVGIGAFLYSEMHTAGTNLTDAFAVAFLNGGYYFGLRRISVKISHLDK